MRPHIRFGSAGDPACFEFDATSGELLRDGRRLRLQRQPARLLEVLTARPGELISREEIRRTLWTDDVHVDFERSLNFCVRKLRLTLDDAAESPRFIETVPTRGYRFIAAVVSADSHAAQRADEAVARAEHVEARSLLGRFFGRSAASWVTVALLLGAGVLAAARYETFAPSPPKVVVIPFHNETGSADFDNVAKGVSDAAVVRLASPDRVARLRVIGNATDVFFSFRPSDMKSMGQALGAQYLVLGQLKKDNTRFRVIAHLIRVSDQTHVWATTFDREAMDLATQSAIAEDIAKAVSAHLAS
jgi:TolB-like protein/DNA-binding winged helix-turn-helix (wHTH) protein